MSKGHLEINAARIYYEARGTGPPLLFIPGGTVDSTHFTAVAGLLADQFLTVTYDRRGNGNSPGRLAGTQPAWPSKPMMPRDLSKRWGSPHARYGGQSRRRRPAHAAYPPAGLVRAAMVHEPPLFTALHDGDQLADHLARTAAAAVRDGMIEGAFTDHVRAVLADAFDRLPSGSRSRMLANAQVFFGLEVPALVRSLPDIATLSRLLGQVVDIPLTFMADPDGGDSPAVRAAQWLADHHHTTLHELSGGHMPYLTEPRKTAEAIRALLNS